MIHSNGQLASPLAIYLVMPDHQVRQTLVRRFTAIQGIEAQSFDSAEDFLSQPLGSLLGGCLITDVKLPGTSGIELLLRLRQCGLQMPTIMLADSSDIPLAVQAMKAGAVDFLEKPASGRLLCSRVKRLLQTGPGQRSFPSQAG